MLRGAGELFGFTVKAADGEVGIVHDVYFDDEFWTVRYVVVELLPLGSGRLVLITPVGLKMPRWRDKVLPLALTREEAEKAPEAETDLPVSLQHERTFSDYFVLPILTAPVEQPDATYNLAGPEKVFRQTGGDPHLRSCEELIGYRLHANDGEMGHVGDLVISDTKWVVRYILVDTKNWLPGKKVIIAPEWVDTIDWAESRVRVDLSKHAVLESPDYVSDGMLRQQVPETVRTPGTSLRAEQGE